MPFLNLRTASEAVSYTHPTQKRPVSCAEIRKFAYKIKITPIYDHHEPYPGLKFMPLTEYPYLRPFTHPHSRRVAACRNRVSKAFSP